MKSLTKLFLLAVVASVIGLTSCDSTIHVSDNDRGHHDRDRDEHRGHEEHEHHEHEEHEHHDNH